MPVYNGGKYLRRALDSLLAQDHAPLEIVISDNASTDETEQICREYADRDPRISYHRQATNIGAVSNFNRVLGLARGEFFMWAAFDDLWEPDYVSACLQVLAASPAAALCHPAWQRMELDGTHWGPPCGARSVREARNWRRWRRVVRDWPTHAAIYGLMRRDAALATRGIQKCLSCDLVFIAELVLQGEIVGLNRVLSHKAVARSEYRSHAEMLQYYGVGRDVPLLLRWHVLWHCWKGLSHSSSKLHPSLPPLLLLDLLLFYVCGLFLRHDIIEAAARRMGAQRYGTWSVRIKRLLGRNKATPEKP
jgi:glycosyltransferase involved in cell wall biosynthesis